MKDRLLLPAIAFCLSGSFLASQAWADHEDIKVKTTPSGKTEVSTRVHNPLIFSQVMNAPVRDAQGNSLGQVKDVILDPTSGRAEFAIVRLSGDVGPRGAYTPVPWSLLKPTMETSKSGEPQAFVLTADREKFASAQQYNLRTWPDTNVQVWGPRVYSHYGLDYNSNVSTGGTGTGVEVQTGTASSPNYYYYRDWDRYGPVRADGTPIDNGTAPDGKGTFVRGIRP